MPIFSIVSHSPNHGITDEFVYEGYPDRESPGNHSMSHLQYVADEEGEGQQAIGAEDYELEETESEISDSDADQVRLNRLFETSQVSNFIIAV